LGSVSETRSVTCHMSFCVQACVPARWLHIAAESYSLLLLPGSSCLDGRGTCDADSRCIVNESISDLPEWHQRPPWAQEPWPPRSQYDDDFGPIRQAACSRLRCDCLLAICLPLLVLHVRTALLGL